MNDPILNLVLLDGQRATGSPARSAISAARARSSTSA